MFEDGLVLAQALTRSLIVISGSLINFGSNSFQVFSTAPFSPGEQGCHISTKIDGLSLLGTLIRLKHVANCIFLIGAISASRTMTPISDPVYLLG